MTYLIDTNVLSELWKKEPDPRVALWWNNLQASDDDWYLPVPVLAEIQEGAEATPGVKERAQLIARLDAFCAGHGEFILDWDAETARMWGRLKHSPDVKRHPQPLWDSLMDAMAVRYDYVIATRNVKDFRHADTFNPWQ